ncbi:MAG: PD40 domain-containing protein [Bacteroidales bacterium]|nr:PD40 domain-containing protein [Bacteroidales bacterium]
MRFFLLFILLLSAVHLEAQTDYRTESQRAIKFYQLGRTHYGREDFLHAEEYLKEAINIDSSFQEPYLVLAEVYWDQQRFNEAIAYYKMGLGLDPSFYPRGYLNLGRLQNRMSAYEDAVGSLQTYMKLAPENAEGMSMARKSLKTARFGVQAIKNPVEFEPHPLGPNVNTTMDEYWPSLSADEQMLVITRRVGYYNVAMGSGVQEDFYFSRLDSAGWDKMQSVGSPLNTPDNEGAQTISADGTLMVYTVCNRPGEVIGRCDLFFTELVDGKWSNPQNMGEPINTTLREKQPSLSADGRTLYFASDRRGTIGKLDIWVCRRNDDGSWSEPVNLGDSINTPGDEQSPFIHQDNKTLYFSSDTHVGMGGFDLFISRMNQEGRFLDIQNLGYPINTPGDEFGLIVNAKGDVAYYASGRNKNQGLDIYQFTLYEEARPREVSYLKGKVFDEESLRRLKAEFELYNLETGELVNRSYSNERSGEFLLCIPTNEDYMLNVQKNGYLFYSDNFALKGVYHLDQPFLKDIPLKPIKEGVTIILKNIFYEVDSYALKTESQHELNKVVSFLEKNPDLHIEISGHTDNTGTMEHNLTLSENRAKAVIEYLTVKGIASDRLSYKGYGFSKPVDTNNTQEGRANNRRTELKILP